MIILRRDSFVFFIGLTLLSLVFLNLPNPLPANTPQFKSTPDNAGLMYRGTVDRDPAPLAPDLIDNEGVYVADVNQDDWPDVLTVGDSRPVLFLNRQGIFERAESFPTVKDKVNAAAFVDYNDDGWKDLVLVPQSGAITLLKNQRGEFVADHRLKEPILSAGVGISVGDYNQNGCPDLFILQFNDLKQQQFRQRSYMRLGTQADGKVRDNGLRNYLLQGNCETFHPVQSSEFDRDHWSLAASFVDVNGDGYQDLYVTNDYYRDSLYLSEDGEEFRHQYLGEYSNRNGMASQLMDVNHDGRPDLYVSNIFMDADNPIYSDDVRFSDDKTRGHNLLINNGGDSPWFSDFAPDSGVRVGGWGWAVTNSDIDNDFDFELVQARQNFLNSDAAYVRYDLSDYDIAKFIGKYSGNRSIPRRIRDSSSIYDQFYEWLGYPGLWDFRETEFLPLQAPEHGLERMDARGVTEIDYDRDGDMDLLFTQYDGPFVLYENVLSEQREELFWIKIGVEEARQGGSIRLSDDGETRYISLSSRTDFMSQETPFYHVGLSSQDPLDRIEVVWNDGTSRSFSAVEPRQLLSVQKP